MFHAEHHRTHEQRHRVVESLHRDRGDRARGSRSTGVVEKTIDAAEPLHCRLAHSPPVRLARCIRRYENGVGPESISNRLAFLRPTACEDHTRALFDQGFHGASSDAAGRACDDRDLTVHHAHFVLLFAETSCEFSGTFFCFGATRARCRICKYECPAYKPTGHAGLENPTTAGQRSEMAKANTR